MIENRLRRRPVGRGAVAAAVAVLAVLAASASALAAGEVGGTGTFAPGGGIVHVVGPSGQRIERILVEPDAAVKRGDVLMVLSNHDLLEAEMRLARHELEALDKASAERVRVQELSVAAASLALKKAKQELESYRSLGQSAISARELAAREHAAEESALMLELEKATLDRLRTEIAIDRDRARLEVDRAAARLDQAVVVAPRDGTVLDVLKRPGESLGDGPAILLGDLGTMVAVCDIYEGDLLKIESGMRVTVTSESFAPAVTGVVERVGRMVDSDTRLGTVVVRLDEPEPARRLIGMQVRIAIETGGAASP